MAAVLIGVGVVLIVLTFLLAFTVFGELSFLLGLIFIVIGAMVLGRRGHEPGTD